MLRLKPEPHETILGTQQAIRAGERSPFSVLTHALDRILADEMDVQAWCRMYEAEALDLANAQTARLQQGEKLGPLAGIPIGVKDIIDIAGSPTGCGFAPFQSEPATQTAPLVQQLIDADAIILGKTVTTQFACFDPPETRNPWNLNHTPGGSSSGSAAAVASEMCLAAIGTQTGGSVTRPAAFCGLVGFKPGFNTLSTTGIFPVSQRLDQPGFFTRTVADAELLWNICSPSTSSTENQPPDSSLHIGHLQTDFTNQADSEMQQAVQGFADKLNEQGHQVHLVGNELDFDEIRAHHLNIMNYEAAQVHAARFKEDATGYLPGMTSTIEAGLQISQDSYEQSCRYQKERQQQVDQLFDQTSVWVCPATLGEAPDPSTTGNPKFNSPWSFLGLPTLTIPLKLSSNDLPLGLQLVAPRHSETELLAAGKRFEELATF